MQKETHPQSYLGVCEYLLSSEAFVRALRLKMESLSPKPLNQEQENSDNSNSLPLIDCQSMGNTQATFESSLRSAENSKTIKKRELEIIIREISAVLDLLIQEKLENEMNDLIEDNNQILLQIKENLKQNQSLLLQQNSSILNSSKEEAKENCKEQGDMSFSDVHKLISEEKKKFMLGGESPLDGSLSNGVSDADLEKSISCLVELKFESIEDRVSAIDKRVRAMEDKYETNLKSIWNVLSMTQGAVFEFLNKEKEKVKEKEKKDVEARNKQNSTAGSEKKNSGFFKMW